MSKAAGMNRSGPGLRQCCADCQDTLCGYTCGRTAVFQALNRLPEAQHGADIMRVREALLAGRGALYRQTILLSSFASAEMNALLHRTCSNWAGCVKLRSTHQVSSTCTAHVTPAKMPVKDCQPIAEAPFAYSLQQMTAPPASIQSSS